MNIGHIFVIGGGTMGQGIAELCAARGYTTTILDQTDILANEAVNEITQSLDRKLSKWGITKAEKKLILSKIKATSDYNQLTGADLVIEAVTEDLETKKNVFRACDRLCKPDVILASNTSTLSLTEIAAVTDRPDKVIGLHFVHPVPDVPLVEIVRGLKTSQQTIDTVKQLLPKFNLEAIEVYESPGFVTTRLMALLINEAMYTLMEGVATAEDLDTAMQKGYQFAYGPLEMADRFGLDAVLASCERLFREFGDTKFRPAPILKQMVRAGHLGVKTGEGFFRYTKDDEKRDTR